MKKAGCSICAIVMLLALLTVGCDKSERRSYSVRAYQMEYSVAGNINRLRSQYFLEYTKEECDISEYNNATNKLEDYNSYNFYRGYIDIDGKVENAGWFTKNGEQTPERIKPTELIKLTDQAFYLQEPYRYSNSGDLEYRYYRVTITAVHIGYVDVTFYHDGSFEVTAYDYNNSVPIMPLRVMPESYEIVYFNE